MSVRPGEEWAQTPGGPPDLEVAGGDAVLATWVASTPGARIRFRPTDSDLARAVGLPEQVTGTERGDPAAHELAMDALRLADGALACNMLVVGTAPDRLHRFSRRHVVQVTVDERVAFDGRATTVVVATGQYLRGADVVPRGHPGDGRAEIQVYRLRPVERRALRGRLAGGTHVPHPRIVQRAGRRVEITVARAVPWEIDRVPQPPRAQFVVDVVADAYRLLI